MTGSVESAFATIRVEHEGDRRHLIFNRPDRRNALTHQMMAEVGEAVRAVAADPGARVLVLRGAGGNFCAGGDLAAMADMPPPPVAGELDPLYAPYRLLGDVLGDLNRLPQAVVAVVEGAVAGGGFGMAVCADVTISHVDAKFALPEARVGFIASQVIPFVTRRIGEAAMRRLVVTGVAIDGEEAQRLGIVHHVCETREALDARLEVVLAEIHRAEPVALAAIKRLVLDCAENSDEQIMDSAGEALVRLLRREQAQEGIAAFLAKTHPPWAR